MSPFRTLLSLLIVVTGMHGYAQGIPDAPGPANVDPQFAATSTVSRAGDKGRPYLFPDGKQQFRNYLYYTFGPPALISTAIGAVLDQNKPAPPEWDSGAQGYGERYGWRFGMNIVTQTTEYSLGALMHEDVAFHRCRCSGFLPRSAHAVISTLAAKTAGGQTVFSVPALVSPYAGSFTAVNAWYPSRYEASDAIRIGSISFAYKVAGNLIGEFIAPRR